MTLEKSAVSYDESRFARLQSRRGHLSGETQKHLIILQLWDVTLVLVVHLFTLYRRIVWRKVFREVQ